MKKTFLLFFLLLTLGAAGRTIDVILIAGQSNATGQGRVQNLPQGFIVDTSVKIFHSQYLNSGSQPLTWLTLRPAAESPDRFGVELSLGTALHRAWADRELVLVKHGLSGSNLHHQWNPGNRTGQPQGEEYRKFTETVRAALAYLRERGHTPILRAIVWQQGEADARFDAGDQNTQNYASNLRNFISAVRAEFGAPDMLFVYGRVMPIPAARFTGRDIVRKAQYLVSSTACSPLSVPRAYMVECDDLQMLASDYNTPDPMDDVHLGTYGLLTLGERFAATIIDQLVCSK